MSEEGRVAAAPTPTPKPEPEVDASQQTKKHESAKMPKSVLAYEKSNGKPYTVDHFKLLDYYDLKANPDLDIDQILPSVDKVEKYVADNIMLRGLEDKPESYQFVMDEVLDKIGDIEVEDIRHKFFRIAKYINKNKNVKKNIELEEDKKSLKDTLEIAKKEKEVGKKEARIKASIAMLKTAKEHEIESRKLELRRLRNEYNEWLKLVKLK